VQSQCRIGQYVGNAIWNEFRTDGAHNQLLWFGPLDNETANYHVVTRLHKGARVLILVSCDAIIGAALVVAAIARVLE
jgi:hypothetical protein